MPCLAHTLHNAVMRALEDAKHVRGGLIGRCSDLATMFKQSTTKWEAFKSCQKRLIDGEPEDYDEWCSDEDGKY